MPLLYAKTLKKVTCKCELTPRLLAENFLTENLLANKHLLDIDKLNQ